MSAKWKPFCSSFEYSKNHHIYVSTVNEKQLIFVQCMSSNGSCSSHQMSDQRQHEEQEAEEA